MDTSPTKQRQQFYRDCASGQRSMSGLCERAAVGCATEVDAILVLHAE